MPMRHHVLKISGKQILHQALNHILLCPVIMPCGSLCFRYNLVLMSGWICLAQQQRLQHPAH